MTVRIIENMYQPLFSAPCDTCRLVHFSNNLLAVVEKPFTFRCSLCAPREMFNEHHLATNEQFKRLLPEAKRYVRQRLGMDWREIEKREKGAR